MTWMEVEIHRYITAEYKRSFIGQIIPHELQVGKLLAQFDCDISRVRAHIDSCVAEDAKSDLVFTDGYWIQVKRRFEALLEREINKIIMEP